MNAPLYLDRLPPQAARTLCILGDTQRTMAYQILLGKERNNDPERRILIQDLLERSPDLLCLVGDLVCWGQLASDWRYFDDLMAPVREKTLPVLPVMGNHDYFLTRNSSLPHLRARFPRLEEHSWYCERTGPLALIVMDSNQMNLGEELWRQQLEWLQSELAHLDSDPEISGIIFLGHHPPFTNSWEVSPHGPSRKHLLPLFLQARKALAYVSGHCHAYERFEQEGKCFIVSGGGGGPRQRVRTGKRARFEDQYDGGSLRPFHYLTLRLRPEGVGIEVRGLHKGAEACSELESFTLPFPHQ